MDASVAVQSGRGPEVLADEPGDRRPGFLGQLLDDSQDDLAVPAPAAVRAMTNGLRPGSEDDVDLDQATAPVDRHLWCRGPTRRPGHQGDLKVGKGPGDGWVRHQLVLRGDRDRPGRHGRRHQVHRREDRELGGADEAAQQERHRPVAGGGRLSSHVHEPGGTAELPRQNEVPVGHRAVAVGPGPNRGEQVDELRLGEVQLLARQLPELPFQLRQRALVDVGRRGLLAGRSGVRVLAHHQRLLAAVVPWWMIMGASSQVVSDTGHNRILRADGRRGTDGAWRRMYRRVEAGVIRCE